MKREARELLARSKDSLVLAVEHYNRPWDRGRHEAVLILLDRAFELFLKAAIIHRGGSIRPKGERHTLGFDACVRKCISDVSVAYLSEEEALTLQNINALRDAAQHHLLEISEQLLYVHVLAGFNLYRKHLREVFSASLADDYPDRVLPVSTNPPKSLDSIIEVEYAHIRELVAPGRRRRLEARSRLRALSLIESSLSGERRQPSESDLGKLATKAATEPNWEDLFPGIASLALSTEGTGIDVALTITKRDGEAVHLVPEGTPNTTVVAVRRVNELDYYSLSTDQLAKKCGLTQPKMLALISHLGLKDDPECHKRLALGKVSQPRYSARALDRAKKAMVEVDMDAVWAQHKPKGRGKI